MLAAVAMEWSSESTAVRRLRGAAERREERAAPLHPERGSSSQEDARGGGRMRKATESGGASRGAGTALSEARTVLALALYLLALRALVQLSLQRLLLSRTAGLQGEFDARQARYGRPARPRVLRRPRRVSPGLGSAGSLCPKRLRPVLLCAESRGVSERTWVGSRMVLRVLVGVPRTYPGLAKRPSFLFAGRSGALSSLYYPLGHACSCRGLVFPHAPVLFLS